MSEPKDLATELQRINESLNPLIERAERALAGLKLGVSASIEWDDGYLCFGKQDGQWRLFVVRDRQTHLLTTLSRARRLQALNMLPQLVTELESTTGAQLADCLKILEDANTYITGLESRS